MSRRLFAKKSIDTLRADAESGNGLRRALGPLDLTLLGIGAILGTGIFVVTGRAAAANAGPGVVLSFLIAGCAATFAALCYSEMAAMIPVSGSAYTYAYATMGELVAFLIGWDLILEYSLSVALVSVGWSGYVTAFIEQVTGVVLPWQWTTAPVVYSETAGELVTTGAHFNLPAALIVALLALLLVRGVRESVRFNAVIVAVKVAVVLIFVAVASRYVRVENWVPLVPPNAGTFGKFGISGVLQAATMVFVSYIGFDAVSVAAQETRNPQRSLPIGILASLTVCTLLYMVVALVLTGVVPYEKLAVPHPIAVGIAVTGIPWLATLIDVGAIAGLTSVMLVMLMAQPRILMSMARDGLLPKAVGKVHPRFGTPHWTTLATGAVCALAGGLFSVELLGELVSLGTLFAFVLVSLGVMILRVVRPDLERPFRVPFGPYVVPLASAAISGTLMFTATTPTMLRLLAWMILGVAFYCLYTRRVPTVSHPG
jgi:APA family basic amino acid/polyamine antiporter